MNEEKTIHVIITGGTIDSHFNPARDSVEVGGDSEVVAYLKKLQLHNPLDCTVLFMKDSREIRYQDRKKLRDAVAKSPHSLILVTHGTYTLPDTAQYVKDQLGKTTKTVVFTGSMIPLRGFDLSDAAFNLGYAVAQLQILKPGVYVCMNGKTFAPEKVDKNTVAGRFEELR